MDEGVSRVVLREGDGAKVPPKATVYLHFIGKYIVKDEAPGVFESTFERGYEFKVDLGKEQTIPGFENAISTMRIGEKAIITCSPSQAFGSMGNPHGFHGSGKPIPGDATLEFEVEMLDFDVPDDNPQEPLQRAGSFKEEGNEILKKAGPKDTHLLYRAESKYRRAINSLKPQLPFGMEDDGEDEKEKKINTEQDLMEELCRLNLALVQLKLGKYKEARDSCGMVLKKNPRNVKALFRMGKAERGLKNYEEAEKSLVEALKIENLKEIRKELEEVKVLVKKDSVKQGKFYGGMFDKITKTGEQIYHEDEVKKFHEEARKAKMKKCSICGEEMEEIQLARHIIKRHGDKSK